MSDKYNQIKQTWKNKIILNETANDWKESYGCYPTIKEFINLINEYSSISLNTSNILIEDRLITSNDITWLSKIIINEQSAGMEKIAGFSDKQWEDFLSTIEGTQDPKHPMRIKRAEALKQYPNAMEQRSRAEDPKGWKAKDAAAKKAATAAETTAKYWQAREQEKANTARGQKERVDTPPSAAPPAQERVRVTPQEAAKAPDWSARSSTRSNDPAAVRAEAEERIRQKAASDAERARARQAARPASSSVPPPAAKTSWADRLYTSADNAGNRIFTGLQRAGIGASKTGKSAVRLPFSLLGAVPMLYGGIKGEEYGREYFGGEGGAIAGEVAGAYLGNNATHFGAELGKMVATKVIPQGVQNAAKTVADKAGAFRDKLPWPDVFRLPPKDGPGFTKRNWLTLQGSGGMVSAGLGSNWADEQFQKLSPGYKAWGEENEKKKLGMKFAADLGIVTAGARMGNNASAMVGGGALANWADLKAQEYLPGYKAWGKQNPTAKFATTMAQTAAGAYLGKKALDAAAPTVAKGTAVATTVAKKVATKLAPETANWAAKTLAPRLGKYVPGLGYVAAGTLMGMGVQRAYAGDPVGGVLDIASGGASLLPFEIGVPASATIDAVSAYRDLEPEDREVVNQSAKDAVNIPKQAAAFARGIVPSGLSIPPESEDEKQKRRMLDSDNETVTAPPKRRLQPVNEQRFPKTSPEAAKSLAKEVWKAVESQFSKEAVKEIPTIKTDIKTKFEIPTYTNHPITVRNPHRPDMLFDPIDPIKLPTAAPPTITTTNTSAPTGIQTGTTTFPIKPAKAVPTLLPKIDTSTDLGTGLGTGLGTDLGTGLARETIEKAIAKAIAEAKAKARARAKEEAKIITKTDPAEQPIIPPPKIAVGITDKKDEIYQNDNIEFDSTVDDPSAQDSNAQTERLGARVNKPAPYWDQSTNSWRFITHSFELQEQKRDSEGVTGEAGEAEEEYYSDLDSDSSKEEALPINTTRLSARVNKPTPYWDQNTNSYKFMSQSQNIAESHSGTLNTKSALQARAKKQRYKVTVMENGKKLEVFATSIRGIRRVVYGKKNFRVHDSKGADITNYFKRLMSSNKST